MMREGKKVVLGLAGAGVLALAVLLGLKGKAEAAPPWEPVEPPPVVEGKRFFVSYELSPLQPQEIWIYVTAPYTVQGELHNPDTGAGLSTIGTGGTLYPSDPALSRPIFDFLMALPLLSDINALQLAGLVTLFNFRR